VWDARGRRRHGWPKRLATGVTPPPIPRPALRFTRLPIQGATAPPVLVDLDGDGRLDVVQSAWDGHVHAWRADGRAVRGFPVAVRITAPPPSGYSRLDDRKLDTSPAVADLDGDGRPELVLRTQQMDIRDGGIQPLAWQWSVALHHDGTPVAGWPVRTQNLFAYYGSAQEFVTEGVSTPAVADVDGDGRDEVEISPLFSPGTLYRGDGTPRAVYGPVPDAVRTLLSDPTRLLAGQLPTDAPVSFSGSGAFGHVGGAAGLTYTEPGSNALSIVGALLLAGSGQPIVNVERAYDARTGAGRPGFPAVSQGLNFLGGQTIADVTGDGRAEVLEGADSSALHAFEEPGGGQANGFPKFTTGWTVYAPAVGDVDGDGRVEVVAATREGYLMAWRTRGRTSADDEWWSYRHDERNTSRYGEDTRPPGPVGRLRLRAGRASFDAPGDDWLSGTPRRYVVRAYRHGRRSPSSVREVAATHRAGFRESISVPRSAVRVVVQARDDAGNLGTPVSARRR
jgi:hypothetical protein